MSKLKIEHKPDGWWLEIHNDGEQAADATIFLGETHGPIVTRALAQAEAWQLSNKDRIEELQDENESLREYLKAIGYKIEEAIDAKLI